MSRNSWAQLSLQTLSDTPTPFENYAALIRALLPDARVFAFYDHHARVRWINDESAAFALQPKVRTALTTPSSRFQQVDDDTHIAAVRGADGTCKGAIAIVLRIEPTPRQDPQHVLAPLLKIVAQNWPPAAERVTPPQTVHGATPPLARAPLVGPAARTNSAQALLRRALGNATATTSCAFGALVAAEQRLTLLQRVNAAELQHELHEVLDRVRNPLTQFARMQREAAVISSGDPLWTGSSRFQCIVCPVRTSDDRLAAWLALFRTHQAPAFTTAEGIALMDVAARIPTHVLHEIAPLPLEPEQAPDSPESAAPITLASARDCGELSMEQRLRAALRKEGFDLHAQLISPLGAATEATRHEVLLRLRDNDTLRPPAAFFATAEAHGLLPYVDRWVISRVLSRARQHVQALQQGKLELAVNITAASLLRESFGDFVESQLFRAGIPARALVFEFSEYDVLEHRPAFELVAHRLHGLGCRVALDNCRQGLDIFASIARLPVHRLKIDSALTHHVTCDTRAARAVHELVEVARDIGIETVGECIEDAATCQALQELGVEFAQGFHLSSPRPLSDVFG